jgi:hypothetical protein
MLSQHVQPSLWGCATACHGPSAHGHEHSGGSGRRICAVCPGCARLGRRICAVCPSCAGLRRRVCSVCEPCSRQCQRVWPFWWRRIGGGQHGGWFWPVCWAGGWRWGMLLVSRLWQRWVGGAAHAGFWAVLVAGSHGRTVCVRCLLTTSLGGGGVPCSLTRCAAGVSALGCCSYSMASGSG